MKLFNQIDVSQLPTYEPAGSSTYSLDVVASLTGVSSAMILHYQEHGLIAPVAESQRDRPEFDDHAIRALRQIEYLRSTCGVNDAGLKLLLRLMDEVEHLRVELRRYK